MREQLRHYFRMGWPVWWRVSLPMGLMGLLGIAGAAGSRGAHMGFALAALWGLGWLALLFLTDAAARSVARHRLGVVFDRFVGWSIFWRAWLITMALSVPFSLVGLAPGGIAPAFVLKLLGSIAAVGWAFEAVVKNQGLVRPAWRGRTLGAGSPAHARQGALTR